MAWLGYVTVGTINWIRTSNVMYRGFLEVRKITTDGRFKDEELALVIQKCLHNIHR
jgi:hypothetical protein